MLVHKLEIVAWSVNLKIEFIRVRGFEEDQKRMRLKSIVLCSGTGFG